MNNCCELCRPNELEIKNGLNTCRNTMCGCHWSKASLPQHKDWRGKNRDSFEVYLKMYILQAAKESNMSERLYDELRESILDVYDTHITPLFLSEYERGKEEGKQPLTMMELSVIEGNEKYVEMAKKKLVTEAQSQLKKELVERIEKMKGGGKVISGSIGPLFDSGMHQGYDFALDSVIKLLDV